MMFPSFRNLLFKS
ncbi:hypothetical protein LINPERHAP2_LOCUS15511 [Linum perenne]